ncbi:RNA polymerase sigma factor [Phenylobacterium sp. J367]|uniref:RNA polymerase sigma factor n=1 Tax=Phenylobacterium sp. J367 TaxID=2898435 RepID=UPI002151109E|nr:RNA polymerase sigma factor [Phenylobacterium sp. J367]MCR5879303.1 RNA polymerase sigma factor [Phenylobacterium sp. J367]
MSNAGADELELARRAADGDERAFTALMRSHKEALYRFVRRHVGEPDAAYEVVQETFVAAWKALGRFDGRRSFATWLRAIALNKCRDRGRRLAVRRAILGDRDLESPEARRQSDGGPDPEAALASAQDLRRLDRAISRLPQNLKEPLLLTWLEEMSQQEAADLLGITVKAVETRVYRARQQLAEALTGRSRR